MKIRKTHGVLTKEALDPSNNSHLAPSLDEDDVSIDSASELKMLKFYDLQKFVTSDILAKKLVKVSKGFVRYNIIILPECNKNDLLRAMFEEGWQTFENFFNKAEEEITLKVLSPLKKVENVLNKYREALENATDGAYVELDSVFINYSYQDGYKFRRDWLEDWVNSFYRKFLICFQLSRHDLFLDINSLIRLSTGEVENMHRKININGVEEYIGILKVVGNAIVEDHVKMIADRNKILKKQLQNNLETFGILVDRRDFIIYAMHYYDRVFLVDETDLSFIIPTMQFKGP
ncbi:13169_t:CDS:10, partial [Funneliformis geosporum]